MATDDMEFFDPRDHDSFRWTPVDGYPNGIDEMVLHDDDDHVTRLLRFDPGSETDEVLTHDFYEEVYILEGALTDLRLAETFPAGTYAYRNPGMEHGPFAAPDGCLTIEFRYYQ